MTTIQQAADEVAGVLSARGGDAPPPSADPSRGVGLLGLARERDGLVYIPRSLDPAEAAPLLVLLHGAGGRGTDIANPLVEGAEANGIVLLAPDSRGRTWDVIMGGYGRDVAFLDEALRETFRRCRVDPERVAVGGFSDGASYALSIGLNNGGLFRHVLAFSPGFAAPTRHEGRPRVFVSHGVDDRVLPIDPCSRRLVPMLRGAGYDVDYREFDGGHVVPPEMISAALARFLR
jgi:phospholipase/carboxylesterase